MNNQIDTLQDLADWLGCEHLDASSMSRRMYKDTGCGASVAVEVYTGAPTTPAHTVRIFAYPEGDTTVRKVLDGTPDQHLRDLFLLGEDYGDYSEPIEWEMAKGMLYEYRDQKDGWLPSPYPFDIVERGNGLEMTFHVPESARETCWYYNGDRTDLTGMELAGFTIQTIVEGSDAEVNSDTFRPGTTTDKLDEWVEEMESEASRLWDEANSEVVEE
jgi:hypothetical protein